MSNKSIKEEAINALIYDGDIDKAISIMDEGLKTNKEVHRDFMSHISTYNQHKRENKFGRLSDADFNTTKAKITKILNEFIDSYLEEKPVNDELEVARKRYYKKIKSRYERKVIFLDKKIHLKDVFIDVDYQIEGENDETPNQPLSDFILENFLLEKKESGLGDICILVGEGGTGKTSIVLYLLNKILTEEIAKHEEFKHVIHFSCKDILRNKINNFVETPYRFIRDFYFSSRGIDLVLDKSLYQSSKIIFIDGIDEIFKHDPEDALLSKLMFNLSDQFIDTNTKLIITTRPSKQLKDVIDPSNTFFINLTGVKNSDARKYLNKIQEGKFGPDLISKIFDNENYNFFLDSPLNLNFLAFLPITTEEEIRNPKKIAQELVELKKSRIINRFDLNHLPKGDFERFLSLMNEISFKIHRSRAANHLLLSTVPSTGVKFSEIKKIYATHDGDDEYFSNLNISLRSFLRETFFKIRGSEVNFYPEMMGDVLSSQHIKNSCLDEIVNPQGRSSSESNLQTVLSFSEVYCLVPNIQERLKDLIDLSSDDWKNKLCKKIGGILYDFIKYQFILFVSEHKINHHTNEQYPVSKALFCFFTIWDLLIHLKPDEDHFSDLDNDQRLIFWDLFKKCIAFNQQFKKLGKYDPNPIKLHSEQRFIWNFSNQSISSVDFSQLHLEFINFKGAKITNCNFSKSRISSCCFDRAESFKNNNFNEAIIKNSTFKFIENISNISFYRSIMERVDFFTSQFHLVDFSEIIAQYCDFDKCFNTKVLEGFDKKFWTSLSESSAYSNGTDGDYHDETEDEIVHEDDKFRIEYSLIMDQAKFENSSFENVIFNDASFVTCKFSACSFQSSNMDNSVFNGSIFEADGQEDYIHFQKASLRNVQFQNTNFFMAKFENTDLYDANFKNAILENIQSPNSILSYDQEKEVLMITYFEDEESYE